jgi:hypothetical protein
MFCSFHRHRIDAIFKSIKTWQMPAVAAASSSSNNKKVSQPTEAGRRPYQDLFGGQSCWASGGAGLNGTGE